MNGINLYKDKIEEKYEQIIKPNLKAVLDYYRAYNSDKQVASKMGIVSKDYFTMLSRYPEFREQVDLIREETTRQLEKVVFDEAIVNKNADMAFKVLERLERGKWGGKIEIDTTQMEIPLVEAVVKSYWEKKNAEGKKTPPIVDAEVVEEDYKEEVEEWEQ